MTTDELIDVVRATLAISKDHWVKNGTPIKPEEAWLVATDVAKALGMEPPQRG